GAAPTISPSSVSARRCCGCHPVLAVTDFEPSKQDKKACEIKGLYVCWEEVAKAPGLAQQSHCSADTSLIAGRIRTRRLGLMLGDIPGIDTPTHILTPAAVKLNWMLGAEPLEDHLVGRARSVAAIVFAPRHPCEQWQSENAPREFRCCRGQIVERES